MSFRIFLKNPIETYTEFTVPTLDITNGLLKKGKYQVPVVDILYIMEV